MLPWCIAGSQSDRAFSVATKKAKENMQGMFLMAAQQKLEANKQGKLWIEKLGMK
jgi:hypothetical protein